MKFVLEPTDMREAAWWLERTTGEPIKMALCCALPVVRACAAESTSERGSQLLARISTRKCTPAMTDGRLPTRMAGSKFRDSEPDVTELARRRADGDPMS